MVSFPRALAAPATSFFLLGMRGTGKSSWVRQELAGALFIDLLDESLYGRYLVDPTALRRELASSATRPDNRWVVIDEVQRVPALLNEVHAAIETHRLRFALLGSSARKLRRAGTNLLGGRALERHMHPLLPIELGDAYDHARIIAQGSLPIVWSSPAPRETLEAYVQLYLRQEIAAEGLVRRLPGFARFLPVASLFHGQLLNTAALARDTGVARTTVQGYLSILEDTLLAFLLPAYDGRLRVKERKHPKLYWLDNGVARSARRNFSTPAAEEVGTLTEALVVQTVRAYHDLRLVEFDAMHYWSAHGGAEVDLLLTRGREAVAIEIKSGQTLHHDWFTGLSAIGETMPRARRILVYGGEQTAHHQGIDIWPLPYFVRELARGL